MNDSMDIINWITGLLGLVILFVAVGLWICFEMEKVAKRPVDSDARARLQSRLRNKRLNKR